jgi:hypothetical protein
MSKPAFALALLSASLMGSIASTTAQASTISQTASLPLTSTDFGPSNGPGGADPLVLQKFDTKDGSRILDSVSLVFHASVETDFAMKFTTPATITDSVATGNPASPGPSITLYEPDAKTAILAVQAPNDPTVLARSVTYGGKAGQTLPQSFSTSLPTTSPFYLAPAVFQQSSSLNLTSAAALAQFTGTGAVDLPVAASAFAKITSSSGNGMGSVSTMGTADVTVTYTYHNAPPQPQTLPEPGSIAVWGLAGVAALVFRTRVARRLTKRASV